MKKRECLGRKSNSYLLPNNSREIYTLMEVPVKKKKNVTKYWKGTTS